MIYLFVGAVKSTWANPNVSCTSVVPTVSSATDVFYCLGKRSSAHAHTALGAEDSETPLGKPRDQFTIEALSWSTGASLYHVKLGSTLLSNGLYAGTIVGTQVSYLFFCSISVDLLINCQIGSDA